MSIVINIVGFLFMIVSVFLFGLKGMTTEMVIGVAASCVFLAFANLDKFVKFKGAGFEAELKSAVSEANATIKELKELASPLIRTNFEILARANRMQGSNFDKDHELFDLLINLQARFKLNTSEIELSKKHYIVIHAWDMVREIQSDIKSVESRENHEKISGLIGKINFETPPDIDAFLTAIKGFKIKDESKFKLEALADYKVKYEL